MAKFPRDWTIAPLGEIGDVLMCKRVLKSQTSPMGEIPFYKIGTFGQKADAFIPRELFERLRKTYSYPKDGDILVSAAGTIGRTVVFDGSDSYFQDSNIVWIGNDERKVLNAYLHWWYQVVKWTTEDGGIVSRLYNGNFKAMTIAFPDIPEQRRIAEALGAIDKLIDNLTRRIEKKRLMKQGVMQELLTGKKRLPGFEGEWKQWHLSDVAIVEKGTQFNQSRLVEHAPYALVNGGAEPSGYSYEFNSEGVTITISEGGNSCGFVNRYTEPIWCGGHCYRVTEREGFSKDFLFFNLKFNESRIMALRVGSGLPNVQRDRLNGFSLLVPDGFSEQEAIADILGNMDAEIAKLEAKRDKYIDIKQGMMNDLLTGKVRI